MVCSQRNAIIQKTDQIGTPPNTVPVIIYETRKFRWRFLCETVLYILPSTGEFY